MRRYQKIAFSGILFFQAPLSAFTKFDASTVATGKRCSQNCPRSQLLAFPSSAPHTLEAESTAISRNIRTLALPLKNRSRTH